MPSPHVEWEAWLLFFLRCFVREKDNLNAKIQLEQKRVETSSPLAAASVLRLLDDAESITLAEAVKATGANRNTLKPEWPSLWMQGSWPATGVYYTRTKSEILKDRTNLSLHPCILKSEFSICKDGQR